MSLIHWTIAICVFTYVIFLTQLRDKRTTNTVIKSIQLVLFKNSVRNVSSTMTESTCPPAQPPISTTNLVIGLVVSIAICFAAAFVGSMATTSSVNNWYAEINKPAWNPPNWIFGPVWSALFLMMAVAAWLVWRKSGYGNAKLSLWAFVIQLILNVLWSVVFFGMQQPGWACVEIVVLWTAIAVTICLFYRHSKLAAGLMIPYLMWVSFASFLNFTVWQLN